MSAILRQEERFMPTAYLAGYNASIGDTNPYPVGSTDRGDWNLGFIDMKTGREAAWPRIITGFRKPYTRKV